MNILKRFDAWLARTFPYFCAEEMKDPLPEGPTATQTEAELASKLIDAWCLDKGKQIPWAKAVEIVVIVTKQPQAERDRLLRLGEENDGRCQMCGQIDADTLDFDMEWTKRVKEGYNYGEDALEGVRFGFKIARNALRK